MRLTTEQPSAWRIGLMLAKREAPVAPPHRVVRIVQPLGGMDSERPAPAPAPAPIKPRGPYRAATSDEIRRLEAYLRKRPGVTQIALAAQDLDLLVRIVRSAADASPVIRVGVLYGNAVVSIADGGRGK